jgi:serine/threonine protein kinase
MMNTLLAQAPWVKESEAVDRHVGLLLDHWQRNGEISLPQFWRNCKANRTLAPEDELDHLGALIKADLRCRIDRGMSVEIEDYLDCFPELRGGDNRVISLIYEEFCVREERGESPDAEEFYERYAPWKNSLVWQLQLHRLFNPADGRDTPSPRFPEAGDQFEEYQLISLIGKGGSSRVFLASDLSLGGKRVVLKVSLDHGQEPKTQGVLDHPHIVPVNSVAFQPEEGLRGLSMPFRPGLPLDEIVRRVQPATQPNSAMALWDVLFAGELPSLSVLSPEQFAAIRAKGPSGEGWAGFPRSGTYFQGVAWIAMILARTLHYAHGMHTFHRDVKPGNVLLTLQHGPQLLDFNLAESPYAVQHAKSAVLGGTLPYMAPEQIEAFLDPEHWDRVGARSDIYSLGLVLRELLTGEAPDLPDERLRLPAAMRDLLDRRRRLVTDVRHFCPEIPYALQAIVKQCLCFDPDDRYPDAQVLAEDLERFLRRQPLAMAVNPSPRERLGNWVYRNRRLLFANAVYLSVIGFLAFQLIAPRLKPALETLPEFRKAIHDVDQKRYHEAVEPLRHLVAKYPASPLPRLYLGISQANSEGLIENDPQVLFRELLASPGADAVLQAWARKNPSLASHLGSFVEAQLKHLRDYKRARGATTEDASQKRRDAADKAVEGKYWETIQRVLQIALDVSPQSEGLQRQMALAEEFFGSLESANGRWNKLIDAKRASKEATDDKTLVEYLILRARVVVARSTLLRQSGRAEDQTLALELIRGAVKDLGQCAAFISELATVSTQPEQDTQTVYRYYWYAAETWLTLGQLELARGERVAASKAFHSAWEALGLFDAIGRERFPGNKPPQLESLRKRIRVGLSLK